MKNITLPTRLITAAVLTSAILACAPRALAQTERVVYTFKNPSSGLNPWGGVTLDKAGNIYGVTYSGGLYGGGTVYKLSASKNGTRVETVLHSFNPSGGDGSGPNGTLIIDASGNLYGTTYSGGKDTCMPSYDVHGCGIVFKLIPRPNGTWVEQILHKFDAGDVDGMNPSAGLLSDAAGNLYGTATYGGSNGVGMVFELTHGTWTEKILFNLSNSAGANPVAALTSDASGNLYGTASQGGTESAGTVFELTPTIAGEWNGIVLHNFGIGYDGYYPESGVTFDSAGNLYGTTFLAGSDGYGIVYELTPSADGTWTETIIHNFTGNTGDAAQPGPGMLVFDSSGNLYGASGTGGHAFSGAVFEFSPSAGGVWTEKLLYSFRAGPGGAYPSSAVTLDSAGNIFGTTGTEGGSNKSVYEVVP